MLLQYIILISAIFRALLNVMKTNSHLMKVDALSVRSCLYLMPLDELMECSINTNPEFLDVLFVFYNKVPQDITSSNAQVRNYTHIIILLAIQQVMNVHVFLNY